MVDQAGHHPLHRRSGPHHPHPRPHGGDHHKLLRENRRLVQELGREPTTEEIAQTMEITPDRVREILKISQEPVSLETPIGEEEDSHLGDFIEDKAALAPADAASYQLLKEQIGSVLDTLSGRSDVSSNCASALMMAAAAPWKRSGESSVSPVSASARSRPRPCESSDTQPAAAASATSSSSHRKKTAAAPAPNPPRRRGPRAALPMCYIQYDHHRL